MRIKKTKEEKRAELFQRMFELKKQDGTWAQYAERYKRREQQNENKAN